MIASVFLRVFIFITGRVGLGCSPMVFMPARKGRQDSTEIGSCQRKWPTSACPGELDALQTVVKWVYRRWARQNPSSTLSELLGCGTVCF